MGLLYEYYAEKLAEQTFRNLERKKIAIKLLKRIFQSPILLN